MRKNHTRKHHLIGLLSCFALFQTLAAQAVAQTAPPKTEPPKAVLHYFNELTSLETTVNRKITAGDVSALTIYQTGDEGSTRILRDPAVAECVRSPGLQYPLPGRACFDQSSAGQTVFIYVLNAPPAAPGKYSVVFNITGRDRAEIEQLVGVSGEYEKIVPAIDVFTRSDEYNAAEAPTPRKVSDRRPNSVVTVKIDFKNAPPAYRKKRIQEIYDWLDDRKNDPKNFVKIRVESVLNKGVPVDYAVRYVRLEPLISFNLTDDIRIDFITDKDLPSGKFAIELIFPAGAPPELGGKLLNTLDGVTELEEAKAKEIGSDTKLGLRDFKSKFDFGASLTSSVENEDKDGISVRSRKNKFLVDLVFAPVIKKPLDAGGDYLITPFFLDAKVSSGKISKDTLSLNRILIGTQFEISKEIQRENEAGEKKGTNNIMNYVFRGINASDRDFKRAEAKFNFEFRPFIYRWYNPLSVENKSVPSVLISDNPPKTIRVKQFGYQIQPFAGFEVGRVYRVKRDAFNNETDGRNLRRFFFGTELVFNLTRRANLNLSDTFYVRGETREARTRNYFTAELEIPFYRSGRLSQNAFLSFKRGDEPPFATPSQNAFFVGYRIRTNFWSRTP